MDEVAAIDRVKLLNVLRDAGLPTFELDEHGFPLPGKVLKYYRGQMKYIDSGTGKEKHWTQADLAKRIGVTEIMVTLMETKNQGLDSVERRRFLADLLKIPPALFGLTSFANLLDMLENQQEPPFAAQPGEKNAPTSEMIDLYTEVFLFYSNMYTLGTVRDALTDIEGWIRKIQKHAENAVSSQKPLLLSLLWKFHALCAKIYAEDLCLWTPAFQHLNTAFTLASILENPDLQASTLYRSSAAHLAQGNVVLAQSDIDGALISARNAQPHIRGAVLVDAALIHATTSADMASAVYVQRLLEQAEHFADHRVDDGVMNFSGGKYQLIRARSLMALGRTGKALECLDEAERGIPVTQRRRLAYLDILRAECVVNLKRPKYDQASHWLLDAFNTSSAIRSTFNIERIERVFRSLSTSPYGNSPEVVDLGMALRDFQRKKEKHRF